MQRQIHTSHFSPPYGNLEQQTIICPVRSVAPSSICSFCHRKNGWRGCGNRMAHFLLKTFEIAAEVLCLLDRISEINFSSEEKEKLE